MGGGSQKPLTGARKPSSVPLRPGTEVKYSTFFSRRQTKETDRRCYFSVKLLFGATVSDGNLKASEIAPLL